MTEVKIIKRYANRKLYDTEDSHYVTLDDLAKTLKAGRDVRVLDNNTKNDITATTLTQLMFEKQRGAATQPSVELLREIIRQGDGSFSGYIQAKLARELAGIEGSTSHQPVMNQ